MAPPTKKAPSAAAAAAAAAAPTHEEDNYNSSELNWLQNPHSPTTSSTTTDDPALVPLLSSLKELDFNLTCPICRSAPLRIPVTLTTCPHAFCATCLQSNLQHQSMAKNGTRTDRTCPVCRVRCSEGDVRGSAVLEGVCAAWRAVRGEVLERVWSSSSSGAGGGTGNPAAAADGGGSGSDAAAAAAAAQDGGGGKKRAAASASSSSDTGGRKKRPRRRRGGERSRATAAAAAGNNATDNDDDDSPSSGQEYVDDESDADSDVEFVPKSGGGDGGSDGGGKKKAKKYPTDEEFLDRTLDRSHPIPGNVGSMKKPQLVRLLESYRLSTSGNSLDVLRDRYRQFRMLYNAECHRQSTEPAPVAQLVANVQADELARKQERGLAIMNGSSRDAEVMKNLNAKWTRDANANADADADANTRTNDDGGKKSRADDIPDKMKSKFAELVAEGTKRWKEQGIRMEQKRWGEEDHERAIQQEEKNGGDEGEEPIVLDDGSDDDGLDERKPSAVVAAALEETAEDAAVDEPLDSARAHAEAGAAASSPDGGDDEAEAQISRSPSSESPRTVRASSSSDGLVGSAPASALASSTSASASEASSAERSRPSPQQPSQRHSPPSHYQHHQQSPPVESAGQQRGSVDTRSTRNNTPSTIGPWSCPLCTYDNKTNIGSRDKCEMCDGPRPTNRRPSRNVATFDC